MKALWSAGCLFLLLGLFCASTLQAKKQPEWVEGHSAHFHVVSSAKPKKVERVTQHLEEFRQLLAAIFPSLKLDPPMPARVMLFKDDKDFHPYTPLTPQGKSKKAAGFFQRGQERMYLAVNLGSREPRETAFHEYLHLVMELNFDHAPLWLNEGLALFYENAEIDGTKFKLGSPQVNYWRVLLENKLIPLDVLVDVDYESEYYYEPDKQRLFYGESWLLVHYLMAADRGQRQPQVTQFVRFLQQALPQDTVFRRAFGTDYAGMQKQLEDYLRQRKVGYFTGQLKRAAEKQPLHLEPVDVAVAQAYLADLWIYQQRLEEAEAALSPLVQQENVPPEVLYRLGRIALQRNQFRPAEEYFQTALEGRPEDIGLRYHAALAARGQLKKSVEEEATRATATRIVEYLSPILQSKSDLPGAYDLLIEAQMARQDPAVQMIPVLERVGQLLPHRHDLRFMLVSFYANAERRDEAEELLRALETKALRPDERQRVTEWLHRLTTLRELEQNHGRVESEVGQETSASRLPRFTAPAETPPSQAIGGAPRVAYIRGTLVNAVCSDDQAVLTVVEQTGDGQPNSTYLMVRSLKDALVLDPTESGKKIECGTLAIPVGINYRIQPQGLNISGIVITIEIDPPEQLPGPN